MVSEANRAGERAKRTSERVFCRMISVGRNRRMSEANEVDEELLVLSAIYYIIDGDCDLETRILLLLPTMFKSLRIFDIIHPKLSNCQQKVVTSLVSDYSNFM